MLDLVMLREFVDTSLLISRSLQDKSQRVEGGGGRYPFCIRSIMTNGALSHYLDYSFTF